MSRDSSIPDKRKYRRVVAKVEVSFESMEAFVHGYTQNVSGGGVFIKTDQLMDSNAEVELQMKFPNELGVFKTKGKVVRVMVLSHPTHLEKQLYGVGIRFLNPEKEFMQAIATLMKRDPSG